MVNGTAAASGRPSMRSIRPSVMRTASSPEIIPVLVTTAMPYPLAGRRVCAELWVSSQPVCRSWGAPPGVFPVVQPMP